MFCLNYNTNMQSRLNFDNIQRIAYLGPKGSYSEMAMDFFTNKFELQAYSVEHKTIRQVIECVDENVDTLGVLPVENSIEGAVRETLDNLLRLKNQNIKILAEVIMPIEHCLLARTTEFYSITGGIISHPQALAQCQNFIHTELPYRIETIEATSTAEAARSLANYNLTFAAIGSKKTADIYNLNVLRENINDDKTNCTRFILIGDCETDFLKGMQSSLAFSTENKPGALFDVLQIFRNNNINLSYISSRPSKHNFGEYIFIVNFDGHSTKEQILKTVGEMRKKTTFLRYLGSYEIDVVKNA